VSRIPIDHRLVEREQRGGLEDCGEPRQALRVYERRCEAEYEPIERGEIRGALSGAIADQHLVLEVQRFSGDGAYPAGAEDFRDGDEEVDGEEVDGEEEEVAHEPNAITRASLGKTARRPSLAR